MNYEESASQALRYIKLSNIMSILLKFDMAETFKLNHDWGLLQNLYAETEHRHV